MNYPSLQAAYDAGFRDGQEAQAEMVAALKKQLTAALDDNVALRTARGRTQLDAIAGPGSKISIARPS